jgi:mercuric ion binding protein
MRKLFATSLLLAASLQPAAGLAGERTVTLAIDNMTCALCPITVRRAIAAVTGVTEVEVDLQTKTAVVTFDDATSSIDELAAASANAGYPARRTE